MVLVGASECPERLVAEVAREAFLFSGIDETLWLQVAPTLRTRSFRHDEVICDQGDPADSLLIICRGEVEVSSDRIHLITRKRSEIVGEQALVEGGQRGATLRAKGLVQLVLLPVESFRTLARDPRFMLNLAQILSAKLNEATSQRAFRYAVEQLLFTEFRAHVADPVLQELLARNEDYGQPRTIEGVVLICDIRGFSSRAVHLEPHRLATELGSYLDHAVDLVHRHGGMVDKFIGDALMAIWGWPCGDLADSVADSFRCACALVTTASDFSIGDAPIAVGVGLNAGSMFIGNIGSGEKRQFTVLGDEVNGAARYQSLCKDLDAPIVVGQSFWHALGSPEQQLARSHLNYDIRGMGHRSLFAFTDTTVRSIAGRN
jgi:class 3 adenylate cyclase